MKRKININLEKEDLVTGGVAIICLFLYAIFPTNNDVFRQIISSLTFLLVIPILYVKIILKKSLKDFGFSLGNWQTGILWSVISLAVSLSIAYVFFNYFGLAQKYALDKRLIGNFWFFITYEILLVGLFTFLYEVFFRGFLMAGILKKTRLWSIVIQALIFLALFYFSGGVHWTLAPYLIFLIFSGVIFYFSRSIFYSLITFVIFNIIFDSFFIHLIK